MFKFKIKNISNSKNPFSNIITKANTNPSSFYSLNKLSSDNVKSLPYSIKVLLENVVRNCDNYIISEADVQTVLDFKKTSELGKEIPFKPSRVLLQDFTGVPALVDLAAMRDAVKKMGFNEKLINPLIPVDLVIDHSVQVDFAGSKDAKLKNEELEFKRNFERFAFLKWGSKAFDNFRIVPPGSGIVHQINLEYLAQVVFNNKGLLYPDSVVGTDSHTTMINGLGVLGWGVGGIEAEAVMLGQHIGMVLPKVIGFKLVNKLSEDCNATDLVLEIVQRLRQKGVVGKFVEFFGNGVESLSLADRATISNMGPEYGATVGYFPIDNKSLEYMRLSGRSEDQVKLVKEYLEANGMFRNYGLSNNDDHFYSDVLEIDLSKVRPNLSGPKRPHDKVSLENMKKDFNDCLTNKVGFKGFGLKEEVVNKAVNFDYKGKTYELKHGSVVISAITSCTNTSNPSVMLQAGLLAKNAVEKGLSINPYIKTSLSPGSHVVTEYFKKTGVLSYLEKLGFDITGYGCMTCIGNSGEIDKSLGDSIAKNELIASAVLSGNRNFEGRVHPLTRANYLASPPLVIAYALAGNVNFDFESTPLGEDKEGNDVYLRDIWPKRSEVEDLVNSTLDKEMFDKVYSNILEGNDSWKSLNTSNATVYNWDDNSTYIHNPPFFKDLKPIPNEVKPIKDAYCLLNLGDSITTDHISPAGNIAKVSPAAKYLASKNVEPIDFNTYGSRRGNDEIMARGTFANIRLINKMASKNGPYTVHVPSNEERFIYDVAEEYKVNGQPSIVIAGAEYGSGSSRDWAAKGPFLLGVNAVIAKSFERIHRSNLIGMGILPLQFKEGEDADTLNLTGKEKFDILINPNELTCGGKIEVLVKSENGDILKRFEVISRLDTKIEIDYYKNGGILQYVLRNLIKNK